MPLIQESYVDRILKAKVYDVAVETSLEPAPRLSRRLNNQVLFKREDLQPVFSFKIRGAYNKIAQLSDISAQSFAPPPATMPRVWRWPPKPAASPPSS